MNYLQVPPLRRRTIPYPQGPYTTGCADVLTGNDANGTLARLYYPTNEADIKTQPIHTWSPWYLGENYTRGMIVFITNITFFTCGLLSIIRYIFAKVFHFMTRDVLIPAIWEAPIMNSKDSIPVIIFSHGLCANRSFYSSICNDVASYGFMVVAVEHRDKSASASFTMTTLGKKKWIPIKEIKKDDDEIQIRKEQVKFRTDECSRALDVIHKLQQGIPIVNLLKSSFDLKSLKGKLDLTKPVIAGQSFGGGTVVKTLEQDKRFKFGIALDPWMFPLVADVETLSKTINQPILFILMERFQDKKNITCLQPFQNDRNSFYTIRGAVHQHQVDSAIILANDWMFVRKFVDVYSSRFPPEVPLTINNALILKFLSENLGQEIGRRNEIEELLKKEEVHIFRGIQGKAKIMLGFSTSHPPLP